MLLQNCGVNSELQKKSKLMEELTKDIDTNLE